MALGIHSSCTLKPWGTPILILGLVCLVAGCRKNPKTPPTFLEKEDRDAAGLTAKERRMLFLQVVDDEAAIDECAILEGQTYKYLLKLCSHYKQDKLYKKRDQNASYEGLKYQPDKYRGHVVAIERSVVIEVFKSKPLPTEYGLPGYAVLQALLVNKVRELYELRILVKVGSKDFEKLDQGIRDRKNPIVRVTGFFFKNHTKRDAAGQVWREPLLVAPSPKFGHAPPYDAYKDLEEGGMEKRMPSVFIKAPRAEERLVIEVRPDEADKSGSVHLRIAGRVGSLNDKAFLSSAIQAFKKKLPVQQAKEPSGVLVITKGASRTSVAQLFLKIREAGLHRIFLKDENLFAPLKPSLP